MPETDTHDEPVVAKFDDFRPFPTTPDDPMMDRVTAHPSVLPSTGLGLRSLDPEALDGRAQSSRTLIQWFDRLTTPGTVEGSKGSPQP